MIIPTVNLNLYQLGVQEQEADGDGAGGWFRRRRPQAAERSAGVRGGWAGMIEASDVASVIGAPVPLSIEGTCTTEAVSRAQAYNSTFTVPDTVTDWPPARDQVQAALNADMPVRFPSGFAALAAQARATYEEVLALHARQRDEGDGWYLAAPALRRRAAVQRRGRDHHCPGQHRPGHCSAGTDPAPRRGGEPGHRRT